MKEQKNKDPLMANTDAMLGIAGGDDTIDAAVQENSRNAAQNTPLIRAQNAVSSTVKVSW